MNYDDVVNKIAIGEKIYNLPLRVTYYCRVSTDSDVQLNSLENQSNYYENYIKSKKMWTFVNGYVEEGISGVRVDKRINFQRMIHDARLKKFDLIVTKEVSRFARDLEDSIHYIRELKDCGVGVFFENQNLNTFDSNSELILNIMFNIAQDESKKLSSRVKFGHRQAILKGHILGSSNITGYKKDNCKLVIIEEEAKFVRLVFELYATGKYGFYKLAKKLSTLGYYNKKGNIYDKDTLKRIIINPKYKGFYRGHTYEIMDYRTKRRRTVPKEEQVISECKDNNIPAIVSEELWDKANNILNIRTDSYRNNNYWSGGLKYAFSSKIYCKEHNANYQRLHGRNRFTWSCGMYTKYRIEACNSPIISENDLYSIFCCIMNKIIFQKKELMNCLLKLYQNVDFINQYNEDIKTIDKNIKRIEDKKNFVLDLVFNGELKKEELKTQFSYYENELQKLNKNKEKILNDREIISKKNINIYELSNIMEEEFEKGFLEEFIRKFVDEIIVSKINKDRHNIELDIFLNLSGKDKVRVKGARHIHGPTKNDLIYIKNKKYGSIDNTKKNINKFTYNVYIETL